MIAKLHEDPFPALGAGRLGGGVKDYEANYNCNWWCHNQRDLIYYKIMLLHKVYDIISPFHINTSLKLQASSATFSHYIFLRVSQEFLSCMRFKVSIGLEGVLSCPMIDFEEPL